MQISPEQLAKVKKTLNVSAPTTPPAKMGQAGKVAQTFGQPLFEGERMPAGGMLLEGGITRKPQTKPSSVSLPTIINLGGDRPVAYELDDLVAQGRVLEERFGKNSDIYKLYRNLISEKGTTTTTKFDQRLNPESSVDTVQTNLGIYRPMKSGAKNREFKNLTEDEMGVRYNKKGQPMGTSLGYYGQADAPAGELMNQLVEFLKSRGVKRARSLKIEEGIKEGRGYFENKPQK